LCTNETALDDRAYLIVADQQQLVVLGLSITTRLITRHKHTNYYKINNYFGKKCLSLGKAFSQVCWHLSPCATWIQLNLRMRNFKKFYNYFSFIYKIPKSIKIRNTGEPLFGTLLGLVCGSLITLMEHELYIVSEDVRKKANETEKPEERLHPESVEEALDMLNMA
jgi:hypothetical protein